MTKLRAILWILVVTLPFSSASWAQRAGGDWEFLGEKRVGIGVDRDIIRLGKNEAWYRNRSYRRLRIAVRNNEVRFRSMRLVYLNGYAENLKLDRTVRPNRDFILDLPGERSYLRQIEMVYRSRIGISFGAGGVKLEPAVVSVYGERARRRPRPGRNWREIGSARVPRNSDQVVFRGLRDEGRLGQINIEVTDQLSDKLNVVLKTRATGKIDHNTR